MTATGVTHLTAAELEAGLREFGASPADEGRLEMIVRRPAVEVREVIEEGELDPVLGLVGCGSVTPSSRSRPSRTPAAASSSVASAWMR